MRAKERSLIATAKIPGIRSDVHHDLSAKERAGIRGVVPLIDKAQATRIPTGPPQAARLGGGRIRANPSGIG